MIIKINIIVKKQFKFIRRKDPIELNYSKKFIFFIGSLFGANYFYYKQNQTN
jgi:hypothetical protein